MPKQLEKIKRMPEALILKVAGTATVTLTKLHDPAKVYKTGPERHIWPNFKTHIVAKADEKEAGAVAQIQFADIPPVATGGQITAGLQGAGNFTPTDVCWVMEAMKEKQQNGKSGTLLTNGRPNFFPCGDRFVELRWGSSESKWYYHARPLTKVRVGGGRLFLFSDSTIADDKARKD